VLIERLSERLNVTVVSPAAIREGIVALNLRAPSHISPEQLRALGERLGTPYVLRGTVLSFVPGAVPEVELYLSLVDTATSRIVWSGLHRRTGAEYEGLLRRGAIHDPVSLTSRAVAELLDGFRN
jgi:TolB-like protein